MLEKSFGSGKKKLAMLAVGFACACAARGDVWRDVTYDWSFDQDLNNDGVLQANEVRDVRYWGSATQGTEGGLAPSGIAKNGKNQLPQWQSGTVYWPARGVEIPNTSWLHFDCVTNYNASGVRVGCQNGIAFPAGSSITGSVSFVTRVRASRFGSHSSRYAFLVNNGEAWGNAAGMNLGFYAGDGVEFTNAYPFVLIGQVTATMPTFRMTTNVWYDVGYSIRDCGGGKAEVIFAVAGATRNTGSTYPHFETLRVSKVAVNAGAFTNEVCHMSDLRIGGELLETMGENGLKCFMGDVHRLAIWSRALSQEELAEAIGSPATYFRAGIENGANGEFGRTDEVDWNAAYTPDTAPWRRMPRALSAAHPTLKLSYTPRTTESRGLGALFRVVATPGSEATTSLRLTVGGTTLGTKLLRAGEEASWFVKGGTLAAGANAITLTRTDGSGAECAIDALEMTGSWMLGTANYANGEFTVENEVANLSYLMNWKWTTYQRGIVGASANDANANLYLWFYVPETLARRYDARFTGCVIQMDTNANNYPSLTNAPPAGMGWKLRQWPFGVQLNGETRYETAGVPSGTQYMFDIPRGTLSNGWNVIRTYLGGNAAIRWLCFDYHKLEFFPNPTGTMMLLR